MTSESPTPGPNPAAGGPVSSETKAADSRPPARGCCCCGRACKWFVGIVVLLLLLAAFAPTIASHEPVRSWVLQSAFPGIRGEITSAGASFGWFSPIVIEGVRIGGPRAGDPQPVIAIEKIAGNRPLWKLLFNRSSPGDFAIEKPTVDVVATDSGSNLDGVFAPRSQQTESQREALKALTAGIHIRAAEFAVRGPRIPQGWRAGPIDAEFEINDGVLAIEPLALFDHARLTPRACHDFLKFVAPILADATTVDGEFSLTLDAWQVPLYDPEQATGSGLFDIGSLNVGPGPLVAELAKLLRLSPRILYVKDSPVKFYMKDGRVHHVDLAFFVEGVKMHTQGSVGLDETLDMTVEAPMPKHLLGDGPLATALAQQTLRIPIGGTLSKPEIDGARMSGSIQSLLRGTVKSMAEKDVSKAEGFLEGLIERAAAAKSPSGDKPAENPDDKPGEKKTDAESLISDIIGAAGNLLEERRQRRAQGEPTLLDQLRQRRQQRLKGGDEDAKK